MASLGRFWIISAALLAGCGTTSGSLGPFPEIKGFEIATTPPLNLKFESAKGYRIRTSAGPDHKTNFWLVDPAGNAVYPVGRGALKLLDLALMRTYAGSRFPFPGNVPLSLEPEYPEFLEKEWMKRPLPESGDYMMVRLDEQIPFPADVLSRSLQLDAKEPTYRWATKWLYKERSNSSTLGITERERDAFLVRMIHDYYSFGTLALRKRIPDAIILSQSHRMEDFEIGPLREFTFQFCDVVQIRYPRGEKLNEAALRQWLARVGKPVYLRDVPPGTNLKWILPVLVHPRIIGWDWDRSRTWTPEEREYIELFEANLPRLLTRLRR